MLHINFQASGQFAEEHGITCFYDTVQNKKTQKKKNANFDLILEDENTVPTFEICLIFKKLLA